MAKAKTRIASVGGAIKAYGGGRAMAEAFHTTVEGVRQWKPWGDIPYTDHLGLFLGLRPKLFGVKRLEDLAGV
jgi:hypothetical protein